jgi:hypothetical protein
VSSVGSRQSDVVVIKAVVRDIVWLILGPDRPGGAKGEVLTRLGLYGARERERVDRAPVGDHAARVRASCGRHRPRLFELVAQADEVCTLPSQSRDVLRWVSSGGSSHA